MLPLPQLLEVFMNTSENRAEIQQYVSHEGTLRISGKTTPAAAARHLVERYIEGLTKIDLVVIGANANQQGSKVMCAARDKLKEAIPSKVEVAFVPMRFLTSTVTGGQQTLKDCVVYRLIIISS